MKTEELTNDEAMEPLYIEISHHYQSNTLFLHDRIKHLFHINGIDISDKKIRRAMMQLAIGIKKHKL